MPSSDLERPGRVFRWRGQSMSRSAMTVALRLGGSASIAAARITEGARSRRRAALSSGVGQRVSITKAQWPGNSGERVVGGGKRAGSTAGPPVSSAAASDGERHAAALARPAAHREVGAGCGRSTYLSDERPSRRRSRAARRATSPAPPPRPPRGSARRRARRGPSPGRTGRRALANASSSPARSADSRAASSPALTGRRRCSARSCPAPSAPRVERREAAGEQQDAHEDQDRARDRGHDHIVVAQPAERRGGAVEGDGGDEERDREAGE